MKFFSLLLLAVSLRATAQEVPPDEESAAQRSFDAALRVADREPKVAEAQLEQLAAAQPNDEISVEALAKAAELCDERLAKPERALALYRRLVARFPQSRHVLRARARIAFLETNLKAGAQPLVEYQAILAQYAHRRPEESLARMEQLIAAHPDFPLANSARAWIAWRLLGLGRADEAMKRFDALVAAATSPQDRALRHDALRGRAEAALSAHHFFRARSFYRALVDEEGVPPSVARTGLAAANKALVRRGLVALAVLYVIGFFAVTLPRARGALWPPPLELKFYAPVALLLVFLAWRADRSVLAAASMGAIAGASIIWIAVARARRKNSIAAIATTALAIAAVLYLATFAGGLTDLVVETWRYGPDR